MYIGTLTPIFAPRPRNLRKSLFSFVLAALTLACFVLSSTSESRAQQNNTIATVAGGAPTSQVAALAAIPNPTGVAEDASGNLYIAAQYSYYIYKVTPAGALSIFAGTGIFGYSGDGGPATSAALSDPVAVAVDKNSGNVYFIDNNRIRVVNSAGIINTFANPTGALCSPNIAPCGDYGPYNSPNVLFYQPLGLYVDGNGNLFISDTGSDRVRFINTQSASITVAGITVPAGEIITVAGNGLTCNGPTQQCGDGASSIASGANGARIDLAVGVATDLAGNIYIGDTRDQRIRCVVNVAGGCPNTTYPNPQVGWIVTYAGSGIYCPDPTNSCNDGQTPLNARFHNPAGVWVDATGNLYIADQWDYKIRKVTTGSSAFVTTVAGTGAAGFGGDGSKATKAVLDGPLAVILDAAGNMTIADSGNNRIRQVVNSNIATVAGGGSIGDGNIATSATLADPVTVAWDTTGTNYYIADAANNRIREVAANGNISTVAGNGEPSVWQLLNWGDGGSALLATLLNPNGVAVDANGNIYIADSGDSVVRLVNMQSSPITVEKTITIQPGDIATVAGSGLSCENPTGACGDGGSATAPGARITYPIAVALDGNNNLYIADYYDSRVRSVNLTTGILNTLAGTGVNGNTGDNGAATLAELHYPFGIAADGGSNVYIADSLNNRVRCVIGTAGGCGGSAQPVGNIINYAFTGKPTFAGDGGPILKASRPIPQELALDPAGNLFVSGGAVLIVQRIDAASGLILTVAGNVNKPGNAGFGGDGGPSTNATLDNLGIAVNGAGQLLVDDQGNNRIRQVDLVPVADLLNTQLSFPGTPLNHTSAPMNAQLQNTGLTDLPVSGVQLGGADPGDFAVSSDTCIPQVGPQQVCSVGVTFTPTVLGSRSATLTINTSLGPQNVALTGTGVNVVPKFKVK